MRYFLLLITILLFILSINPKKFKYKTLKMIGDETLKSAKNNENIATLSLIIITIMGLLYYGLIVWYFKSLLITVYAVILIILFLKETNTLSDYMFNKRKSKILNSKVYYFLSNLLDITFFIIVIVKLIMK